MNTSILDNDLYKFSMQQAVLALYPTAYVTYEFTNRNLSMFFSEECTKYILECVKNMKNLQITDSEYEYIRNLDIFTPMYVEYLKNYRFNPDEVSIKCDTGQLKITISGLWHKTILWEVVLMSIISEAYFKFMDTDWIYKNQIELIKNKSNILFDKCNYSDFGTRRRRSYNTQDIIVDMLAERGNFQGTSNVHFAMKYGIKPIGTMAHEFIMGASAIHGLRHANKFALYDWLKVYDGKLGIALTDTFGTDAFFKDFDPVLARAYDGVRHDSGDPYVFTNKVISFYNSIGINPLFKKIVFSDGLDCETAVKLADYCSNKITCSFGIGTHFTNDFKNISTGDKSKPLNMVIKLRTCDGVNVVKLSDTPSKATGDSDAVRVAKWTFLGEPL